MPSNVIRILVEIMDSKTKFPSWLAPIIGAVLPVGMAIVGQFKSEQTILAVWEVELEKLILMSFLGFSGGVIIWLYDFFRKRK